MQSQQYLCADLGLCGFTWRSYPPNAPAICYVHFHVIDHFMCQFLFTLTSNLTAQISLRYSLLEESSDPDSAFNC